MHQVLRQAVHCTVDILADIREGASQMAVVHQTEAEVHQRAAFQEEAPASYQVEVAWYLA